MADGGIKFLISYICFLTFIALIGTHGFSEIRSSDQITTPDPPETGSILDSLSGALDAIGYFIFLQGITFLGVAPAFALFLSLPGNVVMIYIIVLIIRGGG